MKRAVLSLAILFVLSFGAVAQQRAPLAEQQKSSRFSLNLIDPEGFVGLRVGNSLRYAEDLLGEPDVVGNGKREWYFRDPDFEPFEALTALADKGTITGFIAHVKQNRVQFKEFSLVPSQNRFGTFHATRRYETGDYQVDMLVVGDDSTFVRRITMQATKLKK
jgi:hypothetical protein